MDSNYFNFCEEMFRTWIANNDNKEWHDFKELFDLEFLPEPYLTISNGNTEKTMIVMNNNPGIGMGHQSILTIFSDSSSIKKSMSYNKISTILGDYYLSKQFIKDCNGNTNAYNRGLKSVGFAKKLGYDYIISVETIPFHSGRLNKPKVLKLYKTSVYYRRYYEYLKEYLRDKSVILISSINSQQSITKESIIKNEWLMFQSSLINFSLQDCKIIGLNYKNSKITVAAAVHKNKLMLLSMGHNNFPIITDDKFKHILVNFKE
ncbi:hypothetical protein J4437_06960 [Candidatus Woesearchaeota archaeon]|nr:hypothetical protein [Candidatus Woesearchaeota archaeon]